MCDAPNGRREAAGAGQIGQEPVMAMATVAAKAIKAKTTWPTAGPPDSFSLDTNLGEGVDARMT